MPQDTIDLALFKDLQDAAGADFVIELVGTFEEEAPTMLTELQAALERGDAAAFRRAAHSLKTNAKTFGANALSERARALELGGLPADAAALPTLRAAYDEAIAALQDLARG